MFFTGTLYGITFLITIIFSIIYQRKDNENNKLINGLLILGIILPLVLIAALRYNVGIDYGEYYKAYKIIMEKKSIKLLFTYYSREPLFVLATYIGGFLDIFNNSIPVFAVYSLIFVGFIFSGIKYFKDKISVPLAMFIFCMTYYLVSLSLVRQMMAVAIVFWNFRNILDKKPIKYLIFTVIAGMFHKTAYIMIFLYLLNYKINSRKINKIYYILIVLSPILIYPAYKIIKFIINITGIYSEYLELVPEISLTFLLYVIPILVILTINKKEILKLDSRYEILFRILYMQIPIQLLGCFISTIDRLALYFGIFQIIAIPLILKINFNNKLDNKYLSKLPVKVQNCCKNLYVKLNNEKIWKIIIISWYIFYFVVMYLILNSNGVFPYQTILLK